MSSTSAGPTTAEARAARNARLQARLEKRYAAERRFKLFALASVVFSGIVLAILLVTMTANGIGGFTRAELDVKVDFPSAGLTVTEGRLRQPGAESALRSAGLPEVLAFSATEAFGQDVADQLGNGAWRDLAKQLVRDPSMLSRDTVVSVPVGRDLASAVRGDGNSEMRAMAQRLEEQGVLHRAFDWGFLERADATDPQEAGIWGALKGSLLTMIVTLALAFPIGVLAAVYLEEYAPKNKWTDIIEVSINNLAAVPSIIFGLLGLAVFLAIFPSYRSAPLIGGMTLALMTMPVIVISGRNAIKSVPPSIRDGALAVGASPVQVVFHHVLPLALPGILTGTIIGMARALGETAPLLMIGMRAFVASPPDGFTSPSSVLPVQIFLWSDEIDRGFVERTSAAIIVLLLFLLAMNGLAIYLRNRFERRW
ncbi:phosphate ABC transporter permease PstA [Croceicoccus naphthovorans]|uniref:Phosphate transport system permease protein PstA n=1 Tax=Croceicoccus naphthovorans TaxID=1348774 RepID=A0A0G3XGL0_9SPHN|nr:phosphate ABC transporter permease PstA [Croceicoccus naphthovorans]AKM09749.1 phosphate ABC transporter permease [Croceicoccus naphthovorans]MBB3990708.1 phosphate transport system permease protein [Croceicoccus naphthovorans]